MFAIRPAQRRDLPALADIETTAAHPWSEDRLTRQLRCRTTGSLVADLDGVAAGYLLWDAHPDHLHLLHLATAPRYRRRGVAAQLVSALTKKLTGRAAWADACVPEDNLPAQLLLKSQGWLAVHVLRNWFPEEGLDAFQMETRPKRK